MGSEMCIRDRFVTWFEYPERCARHGHEVGSKDKQRKLGCGHIWANEQDSLKVLFPVPRFDWVFLTPSVM